MEEFKALEIINNFTNGDISDFKKQLKRLSKKELLKLIDIWKVNYRDTLEEIIEILRREV